MTVMITAAESGLRRLSGRIVSDRPDRQKNRKTHFAIAYAPKHVSGSECALIGLLENILAPLWVFARFGDVPSAWTVAGGALLLATLVGHEVATREPVRVSQPGARGYRTVNNL